MGPVACCVESDVRAREALYHRFSDRIVKNRFLDRSLISFQANRKLPFYRWLKYKEGFSAEFVRYVIRELTDSKGTLLDPFAGVGTAIFEGRAMGWDAVGIELLPVGHTTMLARLAAERVKKEPFERALGRISSVCRDDYSDERFKLQHIPISAGAFSKNTERALATYRAFCSKLNNAELRKVFEFAALSILESVSYTRKDGQYLRWDKRAHKKRVKSSFNKGKIAKFDLAIRTKLQDIYEDLFAKDQTLFPGLSAEKETGRQGMLDLRHGSCLDILPQIESDSIDLVVTSPPYCNRYDYTRTYALELVYLGMDSEEVKSLRQEMLSCTVENKAKLEELESKYEHRQQSSVFQRVFDVFRQEEALHEVLNILEEFGRCGELNNANIPQMVRNYFLEMTFVIYEMSRVVRCGGKVVMVNDNVRYAGEEIPVDLILSDIAEHFGFYARYIWTLARGKGNSSQQMGSHGRHELRKCVYVWEKR